MSLRDLFAPHLNRGVRFGRRRAFTAGPRMHLAHYALELPPAPASCDYSPKARGVLADIYGNDQVGDCVVAGAYHCEAVATGNASGAAYEARLAQILADYSAISGYVPGKPETDVGCNEQDALNYWQRHGFSNGTKLAGWLAVNAANQSEVMQAMYLFENLVFGLELPEPWVDPFPSSDGFTWGQAGPSNPENGHCVVGVGYDSSGVKIDTWGLLGTLTWTAVSKYAVAAEGGELYVMLTPDLLAKGQANAPSGLDWASLIRDFDALGGKVPLPNVPPAPPPAHTQTLAQAQAILAAGWPK